MLLLPRQFLKPGWRDPCKPDNAGRIASPKAKIRLIRELCAQTREYRTGLNNETHLLLCSKADSASPSAVAFAPALRRAILRVDAKAEADGVSPSVEPSGGLLGGGWRRCLSMRFVDDQRIKS